MDLEKDGQLWFSGLTPQFLCDSAQECADREESNVKDISGYKLIKKESATVGGLSAVRLVYQTDFGGTNEKVIWDGFFVYRKIGDKPYSYNFKLESFPETYETDKKVFEQTVETIKFVQPK